MSTPVGWTLFETERCVTGSGSSPAGEDDSTAGQQRRAKKAQALCRPVICVCNDLYAQVIRPLREVAATFQFKQPMVRGRHQGLHEVAWP